MRLEERKLEANRKKAEEEKKMEEERKRQMEDKIQKEEEEKKEKERQREEDQRRVAAILRETERKRKDEEDRQKEAKRMQDAEDKEREEYMVDEKVSKSQILMTPGYKYSTQGFASLCRAGGPDKVSKCLEHNPQLLNCMAGQPLREAVKGRNLPMIDTLIDRKDLKVNLKSEHFSMKTLFLTNI
jgi:hypothetical protein